MKVLKQLIFLVGLLSLCGVASAKKPTERNPAQIGNVDTLKHSEGIVFQPKNLEVKNVIICAAECNDEVLGHRGHDFAKVGTIYYASANQDNIDNTNICVSNSKKIEIIVSRINDVNPASCLDILSGKYQNKTVTIRTGNKAQKPATAASDESVYLSIDIQ